MTDTACTLQIAWIVTLDAEGKATQLGDPYTSFFPVLPRIGERIQHGMHFWRVVDVCHYTSNRQHDIQRPKLTIQREASSSPAGRALADGEIEEMSALLLPKSDWQVHTGFRMGVKFAEKHHRIAAGGPKGAE